jgi:hypothetical protein
MGGRSTREKADCVLTFAANISLHAPKFWLDAAANQLDPIPESVETSG